jgi:gentisate 1,2-dioxygenase
VEPRGFEPLTSAVQRRYDTLPELSREAGDLFCTPIHTWHQHVNTDPARPARYLEITTIPLMKSLGDWYIEAGNYKEPESSSSHDEAEQH